MLPVTATQRKLAAVRDVPQPKRTRDLRDAVREAVDAMTWLGPSDEAMKTLALSQAAAIEEAFDRAEEAAAIARDADGDPDIYKRLAKLGAAVDATKTLGWLGPQLQGVLRDLGGTPAARLAMQPEKPVGGRLAELRARATPPG